MSFPQTRLKRLRKNDSMRRLVRQTALSVDNLVYPLFVCEGVNLKAPIASMPGCFHFSPDTVAAEAAAVASLGIPAVLLFGIPSKKDDIASAASSDNGPVPSAVREIKKACPDLLVITDVCLCAYTSHGHCGIVQDGKIDNDRTCELLAMQALSHAHAGADIVAPSDMMDGRVGIIRWTLDEAGLTDTAIMSYSAKYASAFYGPFRDAVDSAPAFGDRKTYQMDPANSNEALTEIELDIREGADIVMIKPAICFLDIIYRARQRFDIPIAAYNVSGEYMMLKSAAAAGLINEPAAMLEMLLSIKRAGADIIITYFAKDAAKILRR